MLKTNAMRALDKAGIHYTPYFDEPDETDLSREFTSAAQIGLPQEFLFKTLVARGDKHGLLVFCIPVNLELDLKKACRRCKR